MNEIDKDLVNDRILPDVQKWLNARPRTSDKRSLNTAVGRNKTRRNTRQFKRLKTVRCSCGFKILVVPDVEAMTYVINEHAAKHWNNQAVAGNLSKQVIVAVSKEKSVPKSFFREPKT